jgi:hypothetical protein
MQGVSTCKQIHAMLQEKYVNDHICANKKPPVPKLKDDHEYAAAKKLAEREALPDKGERPDRDPQVRKHRLAGVPSC